MEAIIFYRKCYQFAIDIMVKLQRSIYEGIGTI